MTKGNKTSNARETVYDRCAYVGCYNGKFINGRRLFHFPSETDRRLEMWIERSGNFRLRTWAATSLRKAGLCGDHFDDKCFTNATRKALRRNVVPRHYTEDLKFRKASSESIATNVENNDTNGNISAVEQDKDDSANCERLSSTPADSTAATQLRTNGACDETSSQSDEFEVNEGETKATGGKSPSLVVEFIVEELDERLINDESLKPENPYSPDRESSVGDSIFEYEDKLQVENEESWEEAASPMRLEEAKDSRLSGGSSGLRVNRSHSDVRTYYRSKSHRQPKLEAASGDSEALSDDEVSLTIENDPTSRTNNSVCEDECHEKMLLSYRNENQQLRKTMRILKQKLRRAKLRETNYMKVREMLKNVDEFLDIQECTNPVARAMVKLALHKRNTLYTQEEKDFATQLYRQSSTAFISLRRAGCNFPGKSTMRRWIAEAEALSSSCDFVAAPDVEVDDADDVEQVEMLEDIREMGEGEILEEMDEAVEGAEGAIEELVEHLEEQMEDAQAHEEYLEQLDDNREDEEEDFQ